jgi:two-component system LytT family response regulator
MKLRVLIADDEPMARRRLKRFLQKAADVQLLPECGNGAAAAAAILEHQPDIVFLDVRMPKMDGFEVLRSLDAARLPVVVFVTAFDQFAVRAFEEQALDYLLKPFGEDRVRKALDRARAFLENGARRPFRESLTELALERPGRRDAECVLVKSDDRVVVLRPEEIDWVEAVGDYVRLHAGREAHLLRSTLTDIEQRLKSAGFVRVHRSRLVNLDRIKEFRLLFRGESVVVLKNGARLNASQNCLKELQGRFEH